MKCYFDYCIYNKDYNCLLKETEINSLGVCEECIVISIADKNLKLLKEKQLKSLENREKA